jgi:ABC-type Fe3+ transport system permease subunit
MSFHFETGTYVVIAAMVIFYLRVGWLRGHKMRQQRNDFIKKKKSGKGNADFQARLQPRFRVVWLMAVPAILLMLFGLAVSTSTWFPRPWDPYWFYPVTAGVLLLAWSIKSR